MDNSQSDELKFLKGEREKLKEILQSKPDSEWAKRDLDATNKKIRKLESSNK